MLLSLSQMDVLLLKIERNDSKFQVKFHLHVCKFDCCSSSLLDAILVGMIFVFGISILNFLTKTVTSTFYHWNWKCCVDQVTTRRKMFYLSVYLHLSVSDIILFGKFWHGHFAFLWSRYSMSSWNAWISQLENSLML